VDEIPGLLGDYSRAAAYAIAAGFDGVQLHAANGYLIDQFLRDGTNFRDDDYGGPIENRIRLLREATQAIADMVGPERTAVRLSPNSDTQGCQDSDPQALFTAAAEALAEIGIAFLELREPGPEGTFGKSDVPPVSPAIRKVFQAPLILNSDFDLDRAQAALEEERADAISFGRPFISNPDLPSRLLNRLELTPDVMATWYSQGAEGYIDYPEAEAAAA
jgi:N-ethylmaleimide reductase